MTRLRCWLALPALLIATSGFATAAEIRDKAGLFSAETVRKAQTELDRIEKEYTIPVTIETIDSLKGEPIHDLTTRHAEDVGAKGIYILIAKSEGKIFAEASKGYRAALTRERLKTIDDAFIAEFKEHKFDAGLSRGVAQIETTVSEARPAKTRRTAQAPATVPVARNPVAGRPSGGFGISTLLMIGLGILAVFVVIRLLGALFSGGNRGGYAGQQRMMGPGAPGGPGYGPGYGGGGGGGGGGFMSSLFGGIGGAMAGNWLYDQFSGRHHDTSANQTGYDPAAGAAPTADTSPEWGAGGAESDWGGGGGDTGGAGGDWGGGGGDAGGGGDWGGGGGGGGDWGGGGGDDGGSW